MHLCKRDAESFEHYCSTGKLSVLDLVNVSLSKCKLNSVNPSFRVYKAKIRDVFQVEKKIAAKRDKLTKNFQKIMGDVFAIIWQKRYVGL